MIDKQLRAEIESRSATYESAFKIKDGSIITDNQGRTSAIGIFRRKYVAFDSNSKKFTPTGEGYKVQVTVYRPRRSLGANGVMVYRDSDGNAWLPVDGEVAIRAAALALPAQVGRESTGGGILRGKAQAKAAKERYKAYRGWFKDCRRRNPLHKYSTLVMLTANHFRVDKKTIKRATNDLAS